ncbi:Uu.00g073750.m01.CDS01 [Anthostomella pinea]|uniref:HECT-type E3 ubiquitin transferase n=1 Tax=Anthostomella pinea TaxID=933095 RepID=A0AAI8YP11_9PEZI|nr:Uu.00g073750.m01.CDS01 [Anthostomella pinea]
MGKITKAIQPKHKETLSPWLQEFVDAATSTPLPHLPTKLASFPSRWPFPRGDLYHWIPLLNRFDGIMESFCDVYKLNEGPQSRDFGCEVLLRDDWLSETHAEPDKMQKLSELGYSKDGDVSLIVSILNFTQMLLDHCGNRSIYASSAHLNDLLHSTDFTVICAALKVGVELAQRYQASVKRFNHGMTTRQVHTAILSNHYNIDLDRVQHIAQPFAKTPIVKSADSLPLSTPGSASKVKEKSHGGSPKNVAAMFANDLCAIAKADSTENAGSRARWNGWADVKLAYYPVSALSTQEPTQPSLPDRASNPNAPLTPTPLRRSNTAASTQVTARANRQGSSEDSQASASRSPVVGREESGPPGQKSLEIPQSSVVSSSIYQLLDRVPAGMPKETRYEFLNRLRVAKALSGSVETRQQALMARLLAIQNLAYIYVEPTFIEKVLRQDSDEPRRFQLVYQLAELIHPGADGVTTVPLELQSVALSLLEAIAGFHNKVPDIFSALNATVNHGVLLYVIRKAVSEMKEDDAGEQRTEKDEWRDNLFSLTLHITMAMANTSTRNTPEIISAGLLDIMVEVLNLRSNIAERTYGTLVGFLDQLIYNVTTSFQSLVNANGLDAITNLITHEVELAKKLMAEGKGTPTNHRSHVVDYEIPFYQQQNLKFLLKFIHHLMSNAYAYGGSTDRLLRNLVDKSDLLGSFREIIENMALFGSLVWTNAVTILSDFLNNDPTSFSAIFEAGLIQSYITALTGRPVTIGQSKDTGTGATERRTDDDDSATDSPTPDLEPDTRPHPPPQESLEASREGPLAHGILPSSDPIAIVPTVLNAICLNNQGMKLVVSSRAFDSFFEIFESPEHVRIMAADDTLAHTVGGSFDELARHHPSLRTAIAHAVLDMVARVTHLARVKARDDKWGAKLYVTDSDGQELIADEGLLAEPSVLPSAKGKGKAVASVNDADVQMTDASSEQAPTSGSTQSPSSVHKSIGPYIYALAQFLSQYVTNSSLKTSFIQNGGIEQLLDLCTSPSLPHDFGDTAASRSLQTVISQLIEASPIIGLPSLLKRTQAAIDVLDPVLKAQSTTSYLGPCITDVANLSDQTDPELVSHLAHGTPVAKALLNTQLLIKILHQCFPFSSRTQTITLHAVNVFDYYSRLVKSLGPLLRAAILEDASMTCIVPQNWTRQGQDRQGPTPGAPNSDFDVAGLPDVLSSAALWKSTAEKGPGQGLTKSEQSGPRYQNYQTLTTLLHGLMPAIFPVFQTLGKALLPKREREPYLRIHHVQLAEELAQTLLSQLELPERETTSKDYRYWIVMLHAVHEVLVNRAADTRPDRQIPPQIIAPVLIAFKKFDGLKLLNTMLRMFKNEVCKDHKGEEEESMSRLAIIGFKKILDIYAMIVNGKVISESLMPINILSRGANDGNRDPARRQELQVAPSLVVELRMIILPVMRELWDSPLVEKGTAATLAKMINILKSISNADNENGAYKRTDKSPQPEILQSKSVQFPWSKRKDEVARLTTSAAWPEDLVREAVYRTYVSSNSASQASEYCAAHQKGMAGSRNPIPEDEASEDAETGPAAESSAVAEGEPLALELPEDLPPGILDDDIIGELREAAALSNGNDLDTPGATVFGQEANGTGSSSTSPAQGPSAEATAETDDQNRPAVAKEDLDAERTKLRLNFIDRCLDVIRAHPDSTHEVSELITAIVTRTPGDELSARQEMGETLVNALMSFAMDDDLKSNGRSIAAYAHLLSLLLQDKVFFRATVSTLKENVGEFLRFLHVPASPSTEDLAPWIPYVLLVFEILLSDDEQPGEIKWKAPTTENDPIEPLEWSQTDLNVKSDDRSTLLGSVLEILPRIGKDESLAVSVLRILVIMTRDRAIARQVGDKKNLQRLFVTAKQLSGVGAPRLSETRIASNIVTVLRHVIEDEEVVKQMMRSEIRAYFDSGRNTRPLDPAAFLRHFSAIALRDPSLFVDVSNEMLKLSRWGPPESARGQAISLKELAPEPPKDDVTPTVRATEDLSIQDVKPSTESGDKQMEDASKPSTQDVKRPVLENPDGVVHFLLCELLNYKEVDDKDASQATNDGKSAEDQGSSATTAAPETESRPGDGKEKKAKIAFRTEEHPIFIYRCFLLHCLAELLQSYNRTKVEFINFKRNAPLFANTPVKPRSSVLNYLLTDLLYPSHMDTPSDTIVHKKKYATAIQTQNLLVALVSKTGEKPADRSREKYDYDDEPDLLFVRRFVLDTIQKAYKDASTSGDPFDSRYARMLALAEVMHLMMGDKDKDSPVPARTSHEPPERSQAQIRRLMYEKGYLASLTTSIADIDLAFPPVKRTIKYILRVLRILTSTAIHLSHSNILPASPTQDNADDELVSASSLSDMEDDREETPDLYRNSALGMLEPGRGGDGDYSEDSEEDEDEEMYDDEYDEQMGYESEDREEDVSDRDEEEEGLEGMGPIEGLSGDHDVIEVTMEDDDDDDDDDMDEDDDEDGSEDDDELDSDEMDEDDDRIEIVDDEGNPLEDDGASGWESETDDADDDEIRAEYEAEAQDLQEADIHDLDVDGLGRFGNIMRAIEEEGDFEGVDEMHQLNDRYIEDDDEDEDEDEEVDIDDEYAYEDDYPNDPPPHDANHPSPGWDTLIVEPPGMFGGHHHRHRHGPRSPLPPMPFMVGSRDPLGNFGGMSEDNSHRVDPALIGAMLEQQELANIERLRSARRRLQANSYPDPRGFVRGHRHDGRTSNNEDGMNPLLRRANDNGQDAVPRPTNPSNLVRLGLPGSILGGVSIDSSLSILDSLMASLPVSIGRHGQALHFQISGGGPPRPEFSDLPFPSFASHSRESRADSRPDVYQEPIQSTSFAGDSTIARWTEEVKMIFGIQHAEKSHRLLPAILSYVVPPAIQREKELKAKEAERQRQLEEERKKREDEEQKAQEAKEAEEKAAREQKEAAEREVAAAEAAEAAETATQVDAPAQSTEAEAVAATQEDDRDDHAEPDAMEGIETSDEPSGASNQARAFATIRGEQVDVTELGIDPDYLEALPEEFRQEVIAQTVSSRRAEARDAPRGTGEQTEVFQEFLDALPDDLRLEIVQQERQEQRRRERDESRRQAATAGLVAEAQDMDTASILMTFPPALREQVLMDQGAELLDSLPPEMAAHARRLVRTTNPVAHHDRAPSGSNRRDAAVQPSGAPDADKPQRRAVVQMLDKPGVATLLRLMFINVKGGPIENSLKYVFKDVCENRQNRFEVISTLLQILQDGSTDVDAVERSFAQLSIKAKQSKDKDAKIQTPQGLKRTYTNISNSNPVQTASETSPLLIVQQCLDLLCYLADQNVHVPSLFLTEHEAASTTIKRSLSRKGKNKDSKAHKYAINSLLALLDRELVMESSTIMDSLSQLLSRVTFPLLALDRKQKEAAEAVKKSEAEALQEGGSATATTTDPTAMATDNATSNDNGDTNPPETSEAPQPAQDTVATDAPEPPVSAGASNAEAGSSKASEKQVAPKKPKQLHPPVIPVPNLTLIIKIFVARECSSKTFKETLSTIKNLSVIPGAMLVFGQELARQAQVLSEQIVVHLDELLPHIQNAASGTEIQGVALSKFSPGASDQNKLLRVLTALDHLFAQKKADAMGSTNSAEESQKQDLLATLYRNPTFNALWEKLSACLSAIRQRESLLNVATILLPLIEALMVVCKDTTQTEIAASQGQTAKDMVLSSPQPESHMAGLFYTFTEDHRRILNELVRNNPSLMKGTFSHLVKNPKVLEFDNKRNWFNRSVHNKQQASHRPYPTLQLQVRREQVFHDSFKSLYFKSGEEMKFGKLNIRFHGEEGVDAGGVTREWFQVLARQMFDANYALFVPVSSDRTTFHPNKLSGINDEHLMFFKFIGRVIGKALYEGRLLDCYFSRAVYKRILGKPVSVKDMESFDPEYYKSLCWMLDNDITDIITETFSVEDDEFGVTRIEDLTENGRNIPVTEDNKHDYVRLVVEHKLLSSVKDQMENFLKGKANVPGFHEVIPAELISIFNEQELELLISGLPDVDIDDWKSNTEYHNYTPSSQQIQWFWRALRSFDKEEVAKLLQFVTGTSKVPLNGFKELEGMNGINRFNIHRDYGNKERLPSSHTCFNQLDLPEYESYDILRRQVLKAITAGSDYFGFA